MEGVTVAFEPVDDVWEHFYILGSEIGKGSYGSVHYALPQKKENKTLAAKIMKHGEGEFKRELRMMQAVSGNPFFPKLHGWTTHRFGEGDERFIMFVELLGKSGYDYILSRDLLDDVRLDFLIDAARDCLQALVHLEEKGIVHADVKPENVIFTSKWKAKLCDLGIARFSNEELSVMYSSPYRPPEVVVDPEQLGSHSDIWALGVTLLELCFCSGEYNTLFPSSGSPRKIVILIRQAKFLGLTLSEFLGELTSAGIHSSLVQKLSEMNEEEITKMLKPHEIQEIECVTPLQKMVDNAFDTENCDLFLDLIKEMMQIDPSKRITARKALEHDLFTFYLKR